MSGIILDAETLSIALDDLIKFAVTLAGIWGFVKIVMEIINKITERHDREQAWDSAVKEIGVDREALKKDFDARLDDQDARIQQLYSMLCMSLKAESVILEALADRDIGNGEVRDMRKELNDFITDQIGK